MTRDPADNMSRPPVSTSPQPDVLSKVLFDVAAGRIEVPDAHKRIRSFFRRSFGDGIPRREARRLPPCV